MTVQLAQGYPGKARRLSRQTGLSLVELMVSIAISVTVLSGVVQVLVVSKSNFVTERELSALQENARYAIKYMSDQIRMAGFSGCSATPPAFANSINSSAASWYLSGLGLLGYEYDAGVNTFPAEFRADLAAGSDAVVVRSGEDTGLRVAGSHVAASGSLPVNKAHAYQTGQPFVIATPNCLQVGIFQSSGPDNSGNTATELRHETGFGSIDPGNCLINISGNFSCTATGGANLDSYPEGSRVLTLKAEAYYIGSSENSAGVSALFRERMYASSTTAAIETIAEELVQGVEYMQVLYGIDSVDNNGTADIYLKADSPALDWTKVVTVRLVLRMRSSNPVYSTNVDFDLFEGVAGTDGSDRYLRQTVSTTIRVRNA